MVEADAERDNVEEARRPQKQQCVAASFLRLAPSAQKVCPQFASEPAAWSRYFCGESVDKSYRGFVRIE